jgi:predicted glycoside hydrolase/deacetylase ChbG (UPF0249 family)
VGCIGVFCGIAWSSVQREERLSAFGRNLSSIDGHLFLHCKGVVLMALQIARLHHVFHLEIDRQECNFHQV